MREKKPIQENEEIDKKLLASLSRLNPCQRKLFELFVDWLLFQQRIENIPIRWVEWQVKKESKSDR